MRDSLLLTVTIYRVDIGMMLIRSYGSISPLRFMVLRPLPLVVTG